MHALSPECRPLSDAALVHSGRATSLPSIYTLQLFPPWSFVSATAPARARRAFENTRLAPVDAPATITRRLMP